jgi:MSHA biogenesis protein MshO
MRTHQLKRRCNLCARATLSAQRGFTLLEMVIVIVIIGIVGSIVAMFIRSPIDAYFASARRAAMTDVADTTVRRLARDVRSALPNSIRLPSPTCLEFIPTKTGARYRVDVDATGGGDTLDFNASDTSFNMLGSNQNLPLAQQIGVGDVIAVYNLGSGKGSNAYTQDNTAVVEAVAVAVPSRASDPVETKITIASKQFPFASGSQRFHVIPAAEKVVSYVCKDSNLYRTASNSFSNSCPVTGEILAKDLNFCRFVYDDVVQSNALVQLNFRFQDTVSDEKVSLHREIHVNNTP